MGGFNNDFLPLSGDNAAAAAAVAEDDAAAVAADNSWLAACCEGGKGIDVCRFVAADIVDFKLVEIMGDSRGGVEDDLCWCCCCCVIEVVRTRGKPTFAFT